MFAVWSTCGPKRGSRETRRPDPFGEPESNRGHCPSRKRDPLRTRRPLNVLPIAPWKVWWLRAQNFVQSDRIAVAGNSFGGIETVPGAERASYCAAVDSAGAAQSWADAPEVQALMTRAVRNSRAPIFFFQAENDFDLFPSRVLSAAMKHAGKEFEIKIYPPYGTSHMDGQTFGYFGSSVWAADVFRFLNQHCRKP